MDPKSIFTYILSLASTIGFIGCTGTVKVSAVTAEVFSIVGKDATLVYNLNASGTYDYVQFRMKKSAVPTFFEIARITFGNNSSPIVAKNDLYKDRVDVSFNYPKVTIVLKSLKQEELNSEFRCTMKIEESPFGEGTATIKLTKADAPVIHETSFFKENITWILEGHPRYPFTCRASGNPAPKLRWEDHNRKELILGTSPLTLTLENIKRGDSGQYYCVAENIGGTTTEAMRVLASFIEYAEEASSFVSKTIEENEINYKCLITGEPKPKYRWWHNNPNNSIFTDGQVVIKKNMREKDLGNYTCEATNTAGTLTYTVQVSSFGGSKSIKSSSGVIASSFLLISLHVLCVFLFQ